MEFVKIYPRGAKYYVTYKLHSSEFDCRCAHIDCKNTLVSMDLESAYTRSRANFGKPLKITSGFRCQKHNAEVLGKKDSKHKEGKAIDIDKDRLDSMEKTTLGLILKEHFDVVIDYGTFFHCHMN